jgi:hypothetical protein
LITSNGPGRCGFTGQASGFLPLAAGVRAVVWREKSAFVAGYFVKGELFNEHMKTFQQQF